MFKSTLVKWAVAALLAVPAVSLFASPASAQTNKQLTSRLHRKHVLTSGSHRHHRLHSRKHRHTSLARRHRHSAALLRSSSVHPTIRINKLPPTIDGMNT